MPRVLTHDEYPQPHSSRDHGHRRVPLPQTPKGMQTQSFRLSGVSFVDHAAETIVTPRDASPHSPHAVTPVINLPAGNGTFFYEDLGRKVVDLVAPAVLRHENGADSSSKTYSEEMGRLREENAALRLHLRTSRISSNGQFVMSNSSPSRLSQLTSTPLLSSPWTMANSLSKTTSGLSVAKSWNDPFPAIEASHASLDIPKSSQSFQKSSLGKTSKVSCSNRRSHPSIASGATPSMSGIQDSQTVSSLRGSARTSMRPEVSKCVSLAQKDKKGKLMQVFELLDADGSGSIATEELRHALRRMGESPAHARRLMAMADRNKDGSLDRDEWEAIVDDLCSGKTLSRAEGSPVEMGLRGTIAEMGLKLYDAPDSSDFRKQATMALPYNSLLISYRSSGRITWDMSLAMLLVFIAVVTPLEMGFIEDSEALAIIGLVIDCSFLVDVILNFRTTYVDENGNYITDGWQIAKHYLRTWFCIDFISSLPLDYMSSNWLPNLQIMKFGKSGKVFKIVKMWRLTKVAQIVWVSHMMELVNDALAQTGTITVIYMMAVFGVGVLVCHWLACFSAFVAEDGFYVGYLNGDFANGDPSMASRYLAAQYWAVTTMTTVGYGDITPRTDAERGFAICGMITGCAFYSYLIGYMAVVVGNRNLNEQAYQHRLREVRAWVEHHNLSKEMRHRIWRYFKLHLKMKSLHENFIIIQELSPELRQAVCYTIVHEDVRLNPVFDNVPPVVMTILANIIKRVVSDSEEPICSYGDYGFAMCVILSGTAVIERSGNTAKTREEVMRMLHEAVNSQVMLPSDSFGEEIVLGLERHYMYSVVSVSTIQMAMIPADEFLKQFSVMPDIVTKMRYNYMGEHEHLEPQLQELTKQRTGGFEGEVSAAQLQNRIF